jgi:hypothetical protein
MARGDGGGGGGHGLAPPDADLSEAWTGVVHDTASTATLTSLLCARERASGHSQNRQGLQSGEPPLVVYASDQSHSSIDPERGGGGMKRVRRSLI